jgi:hypothetical protein
MKSKLFVTFVFSLMLLLFSSIPSIAMDNNANVEDITQQAHRVIAEENNIDLDEWIQFDISDIPEVSKGTFPGITQDAGKRLLRHYYLDGIEEKYHKIGDYKPLFLIHKNLNNAIIGFLHEDNNTTIIKVNLDDIKSISDVNLQRASYTVSGSCNIARAYPARSALASVSYYVGSTGKTTTSVVVDSIYCSLTTYKNGIRIGFDGESADNKNSISVGYTYGPYSSSATYEVEGTHFGFLGDSIVDAYSYKSKILP